VVLRRAGRRATGGWTDAWTRRRARGTPAGAVRSSSTAGWSRLAPGTVVLVLVSAWRRMAVQGPGRGSTAGARPAGATPGGMRGAGWRAGTRPVPPSPAPGAPGGGRAATRPGDPPSSFARALATIYKLCDRGDLAHVRISNASRFHPKALAAYLAREK